MDIYSFPFFVTKKGKLRTSHRYNLIPLLPSGPGGVLRELVAQDFPAANIRKNYILSKISGRISSTFSNFQILFAPTMMTLMGLPALA